MQDHTERVFQSAVVCSFSAMRETVPAASAWPIAERALALPECASRAQGRHGISVQALSGHDDKTGIPAVHSRKHTVHRARLNKMYSRFLKTPEAQTSPRCRETRARERQRFCPARVRASYACHIRRERHALPPPPSTNRGERSMTGRFHSCRARTEGIKRHKTQHDVLASSIIHPSGFIRLQKKLSVRTMYPTTS